MKLHLYILPTFVVCCLSDILTQYTRLQSGSYVTYLDMFSCQLLANRNTSCAIRFSTTIPKLVWKESDRCEQLSVDWCNTGTMEQGYTYYGKSVVVYTPPFNFIYYPQTFDILEDIPIAIKAGASLTINFTPSTEPWTKIMFNLKRTDGSSVHKKPFSPGNPLLPGVESTITARFNETQVTLYVEGQEYNSGDIGPVTDIKVFKFVFYNALGVIHHLTYRAAPHAP